MSCSCGSFRGHPHCEAAFGPVALFSARSRAAPGSDPEGPLLKPPTSVGVDSEAALPRPCAWVRAVRMRTPAPPRLEVGGCFGTAPLWERCRHQASDTRRTIRQRTGLGTPCLEPKARTSLPERGSSPTPDAQPPNVRSPVPIAARRKARETNRARESTVDRCGNTLQWRLRTREADHLSQQQVVKPGVRSPSRLSPESKLQDDQRRGWAQPIRP